MTTLAARRSRVSGRVARQGSADAGLDGRPAGTLRLLFAGLVLYGALGKGFAYAGVPPLFVGELLLAVVLAAAVRSSMALPRHPAAFVAAALVGLASVQLVLDRLSGDAQLLETFRGLAPVYYSGFAFGLYSLLRSYESDAGVSVVADAVRRALDVVTLPVVVVLLALAAFLVVDTAGLPTWPSSGVQIFLTKSGDIAVTLVFLVPLIARWKPGGRLLLWAAWGATVLLVCFRSRGALLAIVIGLVVARPHVVRIAKMVIAALVVMLLLYVTGISFTVRTREISYEAIGDAVASVVGGTPEDQISSNYTSTTNWRADWWRSIWADVTGDTMVFHGTGWGDNLGIRHGVVAPIEADDPRVLRLPHNVFFSLAGRAGVVVAVAFMAVPLLTIAATYRPRPRDDLVVPVQAARGAIAAALTTSMVDTYLEAPQGGILVWSLVGFLWWATASHRVQDMDRPISDGNEAAACAPSTRIVTT